MSNGVAIQVTGLDELKKKFNGIPATVEQWLDAELNSLSEEYKNKAVDMAPHGVDRFLIQGITAEHEHLTHEVISHAPYSAYVEFGTKSKARIPPDLTSYAAQFKGGGSKGGEGFFQSILKWVKAKGIAGRFSVKTRKKLNSKADQEREYKAAYAIYRSILKNGINPHPFFFPHLPWAQAEVQKRAQKVVKNALK